MVMKISHNLMVSNLTVIVSPLLHNLDGISSINLTFLGDFVIFYKNAFILSVLKILLNMNQGTSKLAEGHHNQGQVRWD